MKISIERDEAIEIHSKCGPEWDVINLIEDAATPEISRTPLWQWIHHGSRPEEGRAVAPSRSTEWQDDWKQ